MSLFTSIEQVAREAAYLVTWDKDLLEGEFVHAAITRAGDDGFRGLGRHGVWWIARGSSARERAEGGSHALATPNSLLGKRIDNREETARCIEGARGG